MQIITAKTEWSQPEMCPHLELFWSVFSSVRAKYGEIRKDNWIVLCTTIPHLKFSQRVLVRKKNTTVQCFFWFFSSQESWTIIWLIVQIDTIDLSKTSTSNSTNNKTKRKKSTFLKILLVWGPLYYDILFSFATLSDLFPFNPLMQNVPKWSNTL